jgi:threonine dehydratase
MRFAWEQHGLTVEPGGAAALAAALAGKAAIDGRTAIILSGGNVDPAAYAEILMRQARADEGGG